MELPGFSLKKQADSFVDGMKGQFGGIVIFIAVIWVIFLSDYIPYIQWHRWFALRPRQLTGLHGILTMPFVHGGFAHILSNTIPLIITLITLAALRPKTWPYVVATLIFVSGALTWVFGESNPIVGASGLVLGLVTFLIAPGLAIVGWWFYNKVTKQSKPYPWKIQVVPLVVSAVVGFFCLDNLFFNLVPVFAPIGGAYVSWRAHWCGAIAGCVVGLFFARSGKVDALPDQVSDVLDNFNGDSKSAHNAPTI